MTRFEAWLQHASNLLVGGTGVVYGWMRYVSKPVDEFAVVNHPWQPDLQHLHVLTAPLLVFACGMIWSQHVSVRVHFEDRRKTGLALAIGMWPMIASGYFIQVSVEERWRTAWIVVHVATSCLWLVAYGVHQFSSRAVEAD